MTTLTEFRSDSRKLEHRGKLILFGRVQTMLLEVAKPVSLVFCILSLYAVFDAAFLSLSIDLHQKIYESLLRVALAALISVMSGLIFRDATPARKTALVTTLPVQMFCWTASIMLVLFVISWYLETHCILYRDIRF